MDTLGTYLFHFITGSLGILLFLNFLYGLGHIGSKYFKFLKTSKLQNKVLEYFGTTFKGLFILCIIAFMLLTLFMITNIGQQIIKWI